jgi:hypothetical protein
VRHIQVGGTLFKVPRNIFLESLVFCQTFELPAGEEGAEGSGDDTPFELKGVEVEDFEPLLKALLSR